MGRCYLMLVLALGAAEPSWSQDGPSPAGERTATPGSPLPATYAPATAPDPYDPFAASKLPWWVRDTRPVGPALPAGADLRTALAEQRQHEAAKRVLGDHRWRRLDRARFDMEIDALGFTRDPREDRYRHKELEDVLRSNFLKLAREGLERRFGLDELAERYLTRVRPRARGSDGEPLESLRLRLSPQISLGDRTKLGAKLRLSGLGSPIWSRVYFRVDQNLRDDDTALKLAFEHRERDVYLEYRSGDRHRGEYLRFSVRFAY